MARRQARFRVVSQAMAHGQVIGSFKAEYGSFSAAMRKATKDAKVRGYHTTVEDVAQDDRSNRDRYGQREGYLMRCTPERKKRRDYASCRLSKRGKTLLKEKL